jgi:ABC-type cobalt transport system substrate-binding protein
MKPELEQEIKRIANYKPKFYKLTFEDHNGHVESMTGTVKQVINYILNQQL